MIRKITNAAIVFYFFSIIITKAQINPAFLNSSVFIKYDINDSTYFFGTGFLLYKEIGNNQGHVFLVTNKHVLPDPQVTQYIKIRVRQNIKYTIKIVDVEIPVSFNGEYLPNVRLHPNQDVAAIQITDIVKSRKIEAVWLLMELLVTNEKLKNENITAGDEIFILGYPDAIYDPRNISPILRIGVISTVPLEGYSFNKRLRDLYKDLPSAIDGFLIDANIFPGSSGSIVILKQQSTTLGMNGETVVSATKKIPYILGIVSGSLPIYDSGIKSIQRMGLGIVYSANSIRETIELFNK